MRIVLILSIGFFISGCTSSSYRVTNEDVTFEIRAWNQDPIIKSIDKAYLITFEDLGDGYGIDGHSIFYKGNKMPTQTHLINLNLWGQSRFSKINSDPIFF